MNPEIFKTLLEIAPQIVIPIALCYGLSQARRVTNDVASNADKIGVDGWKKARAVHKALFNFYIILALLFVIGIRVLNLIQNELFIAILIAILTTLGIKLTNDIREKENK